MQKKSVDVCDSVVKTIMTENLFRGKYFFRLLVQLLNENPASSL